MNEKKVIYHNTIGSVKSILEWHGDNNKVILVKSNNSSIWTKQGLSEYGYRNSYYYCLWGNKNKANEYLGVSALITPTGRPKSLRSSYKSFNEMTQSASKIKLG